MKIIKANHTKTLTIIIVSIIIVVSIAALLFIFILPLINNASSQANLTNLTNNYSTNYEYYYASYLDETHNERKYQVGLLSKYKNEQRIYEVFNPFGRQLHIIIDDDELLSDDELTNAISNHLKEEYNYSDKALTNTKILIYKFDYVKTFKINNYTIDKQKIHFTLNIEDNDCLVEAPYILNEDTIKMDYSGDNEIVSDIFREGKYARICKNEDQFYSVIIYKSIIELSETN